MADGIQHWDRNGVLENMDGDEDLVDAVLEIFMESAPEHLTTLRAALETADAATIEKTAHSLKGELGYLEVPELSQMARELEESGRNKDLENAARLFPRVEILVSELMASIRSSSVAQ
jgi:HPt (histidine-containing phosphotransfer) domain-containing protein